MKPTVLVAATSHWFPAARLAMALAEAGCIVEGVCPVGHPLGKIRAVSRTYRYNGLAPVQSFSAAIRAAKAQLIIPGDDLAAHHLHHLHRRELHRGENGAQVCSLIGRSLGSPESFSVVYERATLMRLAQEEGVRAPQSEVIASINDLRQWIAKVGFPVVLKADGTSGGDGVRIAQTLEEAEIAYNKLQAPIQLARAAKRALVDYDKTLVWPSLLRRRRVVSGQAFVAGHEATSTVACWEGSVLASLHFEVINKRHQAGPATVIRLIDHPDMSAAVEKITRRLKLSGVQGFDFMLEASTGKAYLIEINPRITQVGHLALGPGRDLSAALVAAMSGCAVQVAPKVTDGDIITLFPQEWMREPSSSYLYSGYHDVPWEEPELFQVCVRHARKYHSLTARQNRGRSLSASPTTPLLSVDTRMVPKPLARSGDSGYE
jgi:Carbamoyl-phosphate synthase L chain, ATP binding domain